MSKSDIHKSFTVAPYAITTMDHEILDMQLVCEELKQDILTITELAEWTIHNCGYKLLEDIKSMNI